MGIATDTTAENKKRYKALVDCYRNYDIDVLKSALQEFHAPDARFDVSQPINGLDGAGNFISRVVEPMTASFAHLHRRGDILFGGEFNG